MDNYELKPCPFCNGKAEICTIFNDRKYLELRKVQCTRCEAETKAFFCSIDDNSVSTIEKAVAAWNTRINTEV